MGSDTPAGKAQGLVVDSLWEHSAGTYLIDLAGLLVLGVVSLVVTALLLRRLDPQRPSRRPVRRPSTTRVSSWLPQSWRPQSAQPQSSRPQRGYRNRRDHKRRDRKRAPQSARPQASLPQSSRPQSSAHRNRGDRRSWRPRSWRSWLSIVLVATAVLVVGDRAAAAIAGYQIRDRVEAELAAQEVEYGGLAVDVAGVPFLAQVATGTLDKISDLDDRPAPFRRRHWRGGGGHDRLGGRRRHRGAVQRQRPLARRAHGDGAAGRRDRLHQRTRRSTTW